MISLEHKPPTLLLILAAAGGLLAAACSEATPPAPSPPAAMDTAPRPREARAPASSEGAAPASTATAAASAAPAAADTAGATAAATASPKVPAGPRIWGKSRFTWINPEPRNTNAWVGYLTLGGSVALKGGSLETARVAAGGGGCEAWYAVEPSGFVCAGLTASTDPAEPLTSALIRDSGHADSPWPFEYGESLGAPRYTHIPTAEEMRKNEWDLVPHWANVLRAREAKSQEEVAAIDKLLVGVDLTPAGEGPPPLAEVTPFVREGRKTIIATSTVAWIRQFDVDYPAGEHGIKRRTFLLTSDHAIIPKDRVKPYPRTYFKGVELSDKIKLPIAYFRRTERPKYRRGDGGAMVPTGESWPARAYTMITGDEITVGADRYYPTSEYGVFAKAEDATVIREAKPPSAKVLEAKGRGTWLDISILGGWLVAYEKTKPVFVTLISPGRGGLPFEGRDLISTASSPVGTFRVDGKFRWATMVSSTNANLLHTEVPYVQNIHGPHALHSAYWHDAWGEPKSGGCINLSPIDSKWMFDFTEPEVPEGWHGLRSIDYSVYATIVSLHR